MRHFPYQSRQSRRHPSALTALQRMVPAGLLLGLALAPTALAQAPAGAKPVPARLEPFAGHDVVFGPGSERVLAAEANAVIEKMLPGPFADCPIGDISVQPRKILAQLMCPDGTLDVVLSARDRAAATPTPGAFRPEQQPLTLILEVPESSCDPACVTKRSARLDAVVTAVKALERTLPWVRVLPAPGSPAGAWLGALIEAQKLIAVGDLSAAAERVRAAEQARPLRDLTPGELLDFALLAAESGLESSALEARKALSAQWNGKATDLESRSLQIAAQALAGEVTAAADAAAQAADRIDVLPTVRVLVAARRYPLAAKVLDSGPLKVATPPRDLLKLRFGIASAMNDGDGEIAVGKTLLRLDPASPEGADIVSAGLGRKGEYRAAIEMLYELSLKHPERDIVLGRLAGLLNALTEQAGRDKQKAADLQAVTDRMRLAAKDPHDVVARFITATRLYYSGKLEEALPELTALLDSGNRDPRIPLYTAMAHYWLGHQEQAERLIARAVEIGPSDPDVFYCRSQIARNKNLPLAIADLERYERMTLQPWATGPTQKARRVAAELALMKQGRLPPDWDKPGDGRVVFLPDEQTGTALPAEVIAGNIPLADAASPVDQPGAASAVAADATATGAGAEIRAAGNQPLAPTPDAPPEEGGSRRWFPALLLAALAGAMGLRLWLGPKRSGKPNDDDPRG